MRSSERDRASVKVRIPDPLRSYTDRQKVVEATGDTVGAVLSDLDRQFPGIRFRMVDEQNQIRKHMKVFVNDDAVRDLATPLRQDDEVTIMQALSGG
jgi:molybdopterin synthase sulfur carrier subunit